MGQNERTPDLHKTVRIINQSLDSNRFLLTEPLSNINAIFIKGRPNTDIRSAVSDVSRSIFNQLDNVNEEDFFVFWGRGVPHENFEVEEIGFLVISFDEGLSPNDITRESLENNMKEVTDVGKF